jgi:hypothetical protein
MGASLSITEHQQEVQYTQADITRKQNELTEQVESWIQQNIEKIVNILHASNVANVRAMYFKNGLAPILTLSGADALKQAALNSNYIQILEEHLKQLDFNRYFMATNQAEYHPWIVARLQTRVNPDGFKKQITELLDKTMERAQIRATTESLIDQTFTKTTNACIEETSSLKNKIIEHIVSAARSPMMGGGGRAKKQRTVKKSASSSSGKSRRR